MVQMSQDRPALATPATYHALLRALAVSRGGDPAKRRQEPPTASVAARWARKTGSDPEAIAWLMDPEA